MHRALFRVAPFEILSMMAATQYVSDSHPETIYHVPLMFKAHFYFPLTSVRQHILSLSPVCTTYLPVLLLLLQEFLEGEGAAVFN